MIPTMILFGLVVGRWWRFALVAAALVWPLALLASGVLDVEWNLVTAAALAVANAAVGVAIHQGIRRAVTSRRHVVRRAH